MQRRTLTPEFEVSAVGLGCMGMSEFYGARDDAQSMQVLDRALALGIDFFDTADAYGPHHNEQLIGRFLASRRPDVRVATKFGIVREAGVYRSGIDNSDDYIRRSCEGSLKRLGVERIDLYYVHRIDASRAIEDTMQSMAALVQAGKIAHVGLCEVSADTLRRAHAVHPVTAVQSEYSLWTRDVETTVLPACQALGIGFVPYSPLGRGFLTGQLQSNDTLEPGDFRAGLPRFSEENRAINQAFVAAIAEVAQARGCTSAQVALAWVLAQGEHIVPIPGTKRVRYLEDNAAAADIVLSEQELAGLRQAVAALTVAGERYTPAGMSGLNA